MGVDSVEGEGKLKVILKRAKPHKNIYLTMPKENMLEAKDRPENVDGDSHERRVRKTLADYKTWADFINREETYKIRAIFQNVIANSEGRPLKDRIATPAQVQRGEVELEDTPVELSVTLRELKDAGFTVEDEL